MAFRRYRNSIAFEQPVPLVMRLVNGAALAGLAPGEHRFEVITTDLALNEASDTILFTVSAAEAPGMEPEPETDPGAGTEPETGMDGSPENGTDGSPMDMGDRGTPTAGVSDEANPGDGGGCNCTSRGAAGAMLLLVPGLLVRRRRTADHLEDEGGDRPLSDEQQAEARYDEHESLHRSRN